MRPAVYGLQYVANSRGEFVGLNLGYNFYVEHEHGVDGLVRTINNTIDMPDDLREGMKEVYSGQVSSITQATKIITKVRRLQKKAQKELGSARKKWGRTPFGNYIISPVANIFKREIIIDNTEIQKLHSKFLTCNGKYTLLNLGDVYTKEYWHKKFGNRKKFTEEDFLYMGDYSIATNSDNFGLQLARARGQDLGVNNQAKFAGAWGDNGILLLINKDMGKCAEQIIDAIVSGNLAIVYQESRLMKDRGCILIDLDKAYRS